jgi:hypothetical protein
VYCLNGSCHVRTRCMKRKTAKRGRRHAMHERPH